MKKLLLTIAIVICGNVLVRGQTFDGNLGTKSLAWATEQKDFNSAPRAGVAPMSLKLWDNYGGSGAPSNYGSLLEINGKSAHLISQLYFDNTWNGSRILYRTSFYGQTTWESWRYLLDSKSDVESAGNLKITGATNSYVLNGNFGVGTINPKNKLDVNGTIHSREVKVDVNGWSDFVFKKQYKLPTLEEVEKHIAEKGFLENIPSEKEVLANGINLGEMNAKLLQKIEELTLYAIEQNKLLIDLQNRLAKVEVNTK